MQIHCLQSTKAISRSFNAHASEYERAAAVQLEIGQRLFERLSYLKLSPKTILDVGCGPGTFLPQLKQRYPQAKIIALDIAQAMLHCAQHKQETAKPWSLVQADMHQMPFAPGQFDLIFSNQVIHWSLDTTTVLQEFNRILCPGGCLLFSTLGPDTFQELRQAFSQVDSYGHVNEFQDMHYIGDCLLHELFVDPVVDMEMLSAHYPSLRDLLDGLKAQGVKNMHPQRNLGLTGRQSWRKFEQSMLAYRTPDQMYPLTYEVVYGHAWKGQNRRTSQGIETSIAVDSLKKSV